MAEQEEKKGFGWLGCLLKLFVVGIVLMILGCAGLVGGTYFAFFNGIYSPPPEANRALAIRGGTLYDGTDSKPREGIVVVIEHGKITCAKRGCGIPVGANTVDATGYSVLPGLTDLHLHFGAPVGDDATVNPVVAMWDSLRHRPGVRRALLESGVTTIRSVGDDADKLPRTLAWLSAGTIAGPQVFSVGPIFTAPDGYPVGMDYPGLIPSGTRQLQDTDAARAEVKTVLKAGFTGIKLVYDDDGGKFPKLDKMVMQAIVSEAAYNKVWVAAHTGNNADIRDVVTAGVTTIEHGSREPLDEETIALLAKKEVVLVPTLAILEARVPEEFEVAKANAKAAFDGGVKIGVGSDTQGLSMAFGTSTHREIELLMGAGIPGIAVLQGATGIASKALGKSDDFGTLEVDRRGDVIIVGEDPWSDPAALSKIMVVIQDGRLVYDSR